jgi:hypothetical protein
MKATVTGPSKPSQPWTGEEDTQLRVDVHARKDLDVIATQHGRTNEAIKSRIRKLGLPTGRKYARRA